MSGVREAGLLFLRLGLTAFGGPAAHIALMREEAVRRRVWLSDQDFMDAVGAVNLIPGPNSTELAMHIGHRRAGWRGLIVSGAAFILPAAVIVGALAWAYTRYGTTPAADRLLYGVKPVMIALIVVALWGLRKAALRRTATILVGAGVLALALWPGVNELVLLFGGGAAAMAVPAIKKATALRPGAVALAPALPASLFALAHALSRWERGLLDTGLAATVAAAQPFSLTTLFLSFLKIGSVLYGSGYVLLAFLKGEFVERLGWLTDQQLLDAIAAGQVTPGPVFTTATFVGYISGGGVPGAALATVGIFLPAFIFVGALGWLVPLIRRHELAGAFLDGVNAASLSLMAAVAYNLGRASLVDAFTVLAGLLALALILRTSWNSVWLIAAAGAAGLIYRSLTA